MKQLFLANAPVFNHPQKRPINLWLLIMLVSLSALLISCGAGPESSKSPDLPEPVQACELLTTAEVEAIIGGSIDEPRQTFQEQEEFNHWMSMCNYYSEEKNFSLGISIMPHGRNVTGAEAFAQYEAELKEELGDDYNLEVVTGIGDYAGWAKDPPQQLTIFQGPLMIIVGIINPGIEEAAALEFNKQFAEKALARLPQ